MRRRLPHILLAAAALLLMAAAASASQRYLIGPGDRVELAVAGLPDLTRSAFVDADGYISLPYIGPIRIAGRTAEEVREELAERLPSYAFTRLGPNGEQHQSAIAPDAITFQIVEYRPIYVQGHVDQPGEQPFRPGLTARQALVRAGGDDLRGLRTVDPVLVQADLKIEIGDLRRELLRLTAARQRVAAALEGAAPDQLVAPEGADAPVVEAIAAERALYAATTDRLTRELAALATAREQVEERLERLEDAREQESLVLEAELENQSRVQDTFGRRLTPYREVAEAKRFALSSAARNEVVSAEIAQVERELTELQRTEARLLDDRRVALAEEARGIDARVSAIRARLATLAEKLAYVGGLDPLALDPEAALLRVRVSRLSDAGAEQLELELDDRLLPGDVVSFHYPRVVLDEFFGLSSLDGSAARPAPADAGAAAPGDGPGAAFGMPADPVPMLPAAETPPAATGTRTGPAELEAGG